MLHGPINIRLVKIVSVNKLLHIHSVVFPIRQFSDVTLFNIRQLMTSVDQAVNIHIFQFHIFSCLVMVLKSQSI